MSVTSGPHIVPASASYAAARQLKLQRVLESHGILTRRSLQRLSHADHWSVDFDTVVQRAVEAGRIRRLGDKLYEAPQAPSAR